jgi:cell division protein FtsZ
MESTFNDHYSSYSKSEPDEQTEVKKSISENDLQVRHNERVEKLKAMSVTLKSSEDLEKIEKEPAYMRRNVNLINTNPSSESEVSKYTLGDDDKNGSELKPNSFLHDNVD